MTEPFPIRYGKWALVTGAARAEGLGFTFAGHLAAQGVNLVLVDILEADLAQRADTLRRDSAVEVRPLVVDLAPADAITRVVEATRDIEVGMLVCNHMYTPTHTPKILDMDLATHHRMIDINARAYTSLIHTFGNAMRTRGKGAIIIVSSGAGIVPTPYTAAYSANKAFQAALGEALWYEMKGTGVDVVVVAAGLMNTQGDALSQYPQFMVAKTDPVVKEVLAGLGKRHMVVPGFINKAFLFLQTKLMSRQQAINSIGNFMAKGLGK